MSPLPPYNVRVSRRAHHVRIEVTPVRGVTVITPPGVSTARLHAMVVGKQAWIERALARLAQRLQQTREAAPPLRPSELRLCAISEEWAVEYQVSADGPGGARWQAAEPGMGQGRLWLVARRADVCLFRAALAAWLHAKATRCLEPWLRRLSESAGLPFADCRVRAQRSRWGSCSRLGMISVNQNLLFLPEPLVRYVLLHELCHTVQLNHGPAFWHLLQGLEPACLDLRRQLRHANHFVPTWLSAGVTPEA